MESRLIGFIGADKYDILLYLSRILNQLKQKVLLVDYSENRALTYCIPMQEQQSATLSLREELEEYNENEVECISYQGVDFLIEPVYNELERIMDQYDLILIDFGFQVYSKLILNCEKIFIYTDQQLHNVMQLKPLRMFHKVVEERGYLLFRQVYDCKISPSYVIAELQIDFPKDRVFQFYHEFTDMKYCIDSQYNYTFHFAHISKGLKGCLFYVLTNVLPQINKSQRKIAYRNAKAPNHVGGRVYANRIL